MLAYAFKGQNCFVKSRDYDRNYDAIIHELQKFYGEKYTECYIPTELLVTMFYDTLNGFVVFNNLLAKDDIETAKMSLGRVLDNCESKVLGNDILKTITCGLLMPKLRNWYDCLTQGCNIDELKWEVVEEMWLLERDEYVIVSGCNKKEDALTFSKYAKRSES